jgi:L-alanine-DL-glutamate epimerase-like enolase superfamily enzyme
MKIERIEVLQADGAWRNFDFVKVTADNGVVGWSEYNESFGGRGVTAMIEEFAKLLIGLDPRSFEAHTAWLYARTRTAQGGISQQAIAAIENVWRTVARAHPPLLVSLRYLPGMG